MQIKIYDTVEKRYLTEDELRDQCFYDSLGNYSGPFKFNLLTCKVQLDYDNSCTDSDCCTPCEMWADSDDFRVDFINEEDKK